MGSNNGGGRRTVISTLPRLTKGEDVQVVTSKWNDSFTITYLGKKGITVKQNGRWVTVKFTIKVAKVVSICFHRSELQSLEDSLPAPPNPPPARTYIR
jgi:hypothetical protein